MPDTTERIVPILPVADIARAIDFYKRLGFSANQYQGAGGGGGYAFLSRAPFEIHLTHVDGFKEGTSTSGVYFYLARGNAALLEAEFRGNGVPILSPLAPRPWRMNEFVVSDPDTNLLRFGEPV